MKGGVIIVSMVWTGLHNMAKIKHLRRWCMLHPQLLWVPAASGWELSLSLESSPQQKPPLPKSFHLPMREAGPASDSKGSLSLFI